MVLDAVFSPDGKRVASAGADGTVRVWDVISGQETLVLREHSGAISSVAFSPDGTQLVSASADGTIKIWDARPVVERPRPTTATGTRR